MQLFSLIIGLLVLSAAASSTDGTINNVNRYAWSENAGWIDFGTSDGNVHVTDSALTGYAWGENLGWISLNCSNTNSCATVDYKVTNNGEGTLGGYAWSENAGWIQFAPANGGVSINTSGVFAGYAWGELVGWIVFNCSNESSCATVDYKVSTDWRPMNTRSVVQTEVSNGGGRRNTQELIERALQRLQTTTENSSSSAPAAEEPSGNSFSDIPASSWFASFVQKISSLGIVSGYADADGNLTGTFGPADPVTIGQTIKIALLAAEHELPIPAGIPQNPTATDWSAPYIALAESLNLTLASENVTQNATRGEVIQALLEASAMDIEEVSHPFTDLSVNHPHAKAIATAHALGIVTGDTDAEGNPLNTVRPDDTINRAEVAALVVRMIER